jgi:hypothetical protein
MSDARQGASGCRNIDWRHRLLQAGAVDLLEGTPYEEVSQTGEKQRSARSSKTNNKMQRARDMREPALPARRHAEPESEVLGASLGRDP